MNQPEDKIIKSSTVAVAVPHRSIWLTLAVLVAGLIVTALAAHYTKSVVDVAAQREFDFGCTEIQIRIEERLKDHELILRSGSAFFECSGGGVSREEWRRFVERQNVDHELPGIQGIGFALLIPRQNLEQHVQEIRAQGFPQYQVRPEGEREIYTSIIYLEPFTNRNLRAFGYDMFSEVTRRAAMERARDQDCAALSGKVILVQETDKAVQAGTLMYVPVYRVGKPHETIAQRRDALVGWVYSPYRMNDLMQGVLGSWDLAGEKNKPVHLEVFDGESISSDSLLYDSQPGYVDMMHVSRTLFQRRLVPSSRLWTLRFTQTSSLSSSTDYGKVWLVLFGGISSSLLFSGVIFSLVNTRFKAIQMAAKLAKEMARSEQSYRNHFTSNSEVMLLIDPTDGAIIDANAAAVSFYGYPREKLLAMRMTDINLMSLADVLQTSRDLRSEQGDRFLFQNRLANGELRKVEVSMSSIEFRGRKVLHSIVFDVTERERTKESLLQSTENLKLAMQAGGVGLWNYDVASNRLVWDDQMFCIYGITRDQFGSAYEAWLAGVHPDDRPRCHQEIQLALRGEKDFDTEFRVIWPDGSTHYVRAMAIAQGDASGQATQMLGTNWDITAQKQSEQEKKKLEAQNWQLQKSESLGRMAAAIAHHFNNQLQAVMMNLRLAIDDLSPHLGSVENLTEAMQSVRNAAEVSTLMLTYLGQTVAKRELLDLSEICQSYLPALCAVMPPRVVLEPNLPSSSRIIKANANQIQQILTNLITNASEAMGERQGIICLTVKTVRAADIPRVHRFPIDCQTQRTDYVCLEVADAGCGIADKDIEKVFDPFFSSKFTGRGMGLAVVLGIVRAHDGIVTVQSQAGNGCVFRIFFPVSAEALPKKPIHVVQAPRMAEGGTVLVVDDTLILRKAVTLALKRFGFAVYEAKDGVEAVEVFQQHRDEIGCVLCDLSMPRMNGWETLSALRKLAPGLPVILCSGYTEAQVMAGDHSEQPQAFLSKPFESEALKDTIVRFINQTGH